MGERERGYSGALESLSSLIAGRKRANDSNQGDDFHLMYRYLEVLDLEKPLSELNVIHVAGTKGKGSTCVFTESILRARGYKTGLFTSPHLFDVRERIRINGVEVSESVFSEHFWWCWDRLKDACVGEFPMPAYFRFLTLLGFKIFIEEKVDVAVLEVGLGGKYDSTNVVKTPVACGFASLGFDHMEILGWTLPEIAGEKAGIMKPRVPAFTVPQRDDALAVLRNRASELAVPLELVCPLDLEKFKGLQLGLEGDHQCSNAALAIALCKTWAQRREDTQHVSMVEKGLSEGFLPEPYMQGLSRASLPGRAQVVRDPEVDHLAFFLDGAHSPESMEVCVKWFCKACQRHDDIREIEHTSRDSSLKIGGFNDCGPSSRRIILFNCMPERDPKLLMPPLLSISSSYGLPFHRAIFAPTFSSVTQLGSGASLKTNMGKDLSWQCSLRRSWDSLSQTYKRTRDPRWQDRTSSNSTQFIVGHKLDQVISCNKSTQCAQSFMGSSSLVVPSLPLALQLLRNCARKYPSVDMQVLVTGSLYLVADMLKLLRK